MRAVGMFSVGAIVLFSSLTSYAQTSLRAAVSVPTAGGSYALDAHVPRVQQPLLFLCSSHPARAELRSAVAQALEETQRAQERVAALHAMQTTADHLLKTVGAPHSNRYQWWKYWAGQRQIALSWRGNGAPRGKRYNAASSLAQWHKVAEALQRSMDAITELEQQEATAGNALQRCAYTAAFSPAPVTEPVVVDNPGFDAYDDKLPVASGKLPRFSCVSPERTLLLQRIEHAKVALEQHAQVNVERLERYTSLQVAAGGMVPGSPEQVALQRLAAAGIYETQRLAGVIDAAARRLRALSQESIGTIKADYELGFKSNRCAQVEASYRWPAVPGPGDYVPHPAGMPMQPLPRGRVQCGDNAFRTNPFSYPIGPCPGSGRRAYDDGSPWGEREEACVQHCAVKP